MFRSLTLGSLSSVIFALSATVTSSALAQERPKIRLSGEAAAPSAKPSAPSTQPAKTPEAKGDGGTTSSATEEAGAQESKAQPTAPTSASGGEAGEGEDGEGVVDSVDSVAGSQPAEGLGPAAAAADAPKDDAEDLSRPRVIDISAEDEEPMDPRDLPPAEPKIPASQLPFTYHVNHIDVHGGFRVVGTYDEQLEPFLVDPVMADVFVRGGMAFGLTDRIAIAPSIELGVASASATVRELDSQIDKVHATLGIEGRYHFIHRMFGYARVAPGFEFVGATLGIEDTESELSSGDFPGSVGFQFDAAVGASLRLFGPNDGRKRDPRLWLFAEGGYRASTKHELSLEADEDYGPRRATAIELAPLHFSGGFFSTGLMASF